MRLLIAAAALVVLVGCGGGEPDSSGIEWNTYSGDLLVRINQAGRSADCEALRQMFRDAEASDDAHRARYGEGNADLMAYIDDVARQTGCYD